MFRLIAYVLCTAAAYGASKVLPESPVSPYVPMLASYHMFLVCLMVKATLLKEQKLGLSMSPVLAIFTHLCFVGGMIGMVFSRELVPLFGLLQYVVPGLAPFEVKWVFEGAKPKHVPVEPAAMPAGTDDDYQEFLQYLRGTRKFQRAGRSVNEEFAVWRADREKKRPIAAAETTSA